MKKVKKWMLLLLTGILAVPQVSVVGAEELSDGEFSYVESTYSETNDNHEILQFEEEDIYTENDLDDGGALEIEAVQGGNVFVDDFLISSADLVYDNIEEHATIAKAGSVNSNEQALHNYSLLLSDVTRYANVLSYKSTPGQVKFALVYFNNNNIQDLFVTYTYSEEFPFGYALFQDGNITKPLVVDAFAKDSEFSVYYFDRKSVYGYDDKVVTPSGTHHITSYDLPEGNPYKKIFKAEDSRLEGEVKFYKCRVENGRSLTIRIPESEYNSIISQITGGLPETVIPFIENTKANREAYIGKFEEEQEIILTATTINGLYNSTKGADIRWKDVEGATGYEVYRKRGGEGTTKVATIMNTNTTHCYDSGIKDNCWGCVYNYYVVPVAGNIKGPKSDDVVLQRLAPMTLTSVKNTAAGKATVTWKCSVNSNKANGYELQYAQSQADLSGRKGTYKAVTINGRNNLSRTISGLTKGKTYYFRIRCYVNYTNSKTGKTTKTWSQYSNVKNIKITK